jgi:hypothetical protein
MNASELKPGHFVRWWYAPNDALLCRVRYIGRDYASVQICTATEEQVIRSGYAVAETVNTSPLSLRPPNWKPSDA